MKLPLSLGKSPLLDALFELRFRPTIKSAGEILPGMLFQALKDEYTEVTKLPLANVPAELRQADPKLWHQAHYRLQGPGKQVSVGQQVFNFSFGIEYPGWDHFRAEIAGLLSLLASSGLVDEVERYSLRYVNLIPAPATDQLKLLNAKIQLRGEDVSENGFHLRTEYLDGDFRNIVQIRTGATASLADNSSRSGIIVDVDTIRHVESDDFWENQEALLEDGHGVLKSTFFSLVSSETIESFDPTWEEST
ncbi:MAG: TIGR04255 family protein [bacterium]